MTASVLLAHMFMTATCPVCVRQRAEVAKLPPALQLRIMYTMIDTSKGQPAPTPRGVESPVSSVPTTVLYAYEADTSVSADATASANLTPFTVRQLRTGLLTAEELTSMLDGV
jgi:hypothetical protein